MSDAVYLDERELLGNALAPRLNSPRRQPQTKDRLCLPVCLHPSVIQTYPTHRIDFTRTCDLPLVSFAGIT